MFHFSDDLFHMDLKSFYINLVTCEKDFYRSSFICQNEEHAKSEKERNDHSKEKELVSSKNLRIDSIKHSSNNNEKSFDFSAKTMSLKKVSEATFKDFANGLPGQNTDSRLGNPGDLSSAELDANSSKGHQARVKDRFQVFYKKDKNHLTVFHIYVAEYLKFLRLIFDAGLEDALNNFKMLGLTKAFLHKFFSRPLEPKIKFQVFKILCLWTFGGSRDSPRLQNLNFEWDKKVFKDR